MIKAIHSIDTKMAKLDSSIFIDISDCVNRSYTLDYTAEIITHSISDLMRPFETIQTSMWIEMSNFKHPKN
jgi:hypothetical protein